ncbi:16S rRNA (guanine(527)-N(7))-methyltransferase RsmG [Candidatus Nomurabacteria bacterium]|nr:16S rRNA (guanine(527)-N(7))-methyltransferase RsmG [Candidatus Nomurabacteria bacterium]
MYEIQKYFPNLSQRQLEQFGQLEALYRAWNSQINVISRKDIDNLYIRHVLHSMSIAKFIDFKPGTKVLDIGTGGGFPGLPLAIYFPECQFILVDSIGKKLKVVEAVASELKLANVKTKHSRAEDINEQFDFVVSRAVTRLDTIWSWSKSKISTNSYNDLRNGLIYLKGGDISAEIPNNTIVQSYSLSDLFSEDFFLGKGLVYITSKP